MADDRALAFLPRGLTETWQRMAGPGPGTVLREVMLPVVESTQDRVGFLHRAGVTLLAGSDLGNPFLVPGHSLHRELEFFVDAGLTPLEALQTATLNPAQVLGVADTMGQVKPGYVADLVLLDANPLEDITNIRGVKGILLRGVYYDRQALERMVEEGFSNWSLTHPPNQRLLQSR